MRMSVHKLVVGVLAVWSAFAVFAANETPVPVTGEGEAAGLGPAARSAAIADAQTAILLDRLEKIAPSRDFSVFSSVIQAAPSFYQSFKVLSESKSEDSTHVQIEGQLLERKLKQEIAAIALAQNFVTPRIIVIAREAYTPDSVEDPAKPGIIEKKLHEELKRVQFELVPPEALRAKIPVEKWAKCLDADSEYAAMLARDMLADIVVLGSATTSEAESKSRSMHRMRSEVALRVVRAEDGYVIDIPKAEAVVNCAEPSEGGAQAVDDACGKLVGDVKTAIALGALSGAPNDALLVTIEGVAADTDIQAIGSAIKQCLAIDSIETVFNEAGSLRLKVFYAGEVGNAADCIAMVRLSHGMLRLQTAIGRNLKFRITSS